MSETILYFIILYVCKCKYASIEVLNLKSGNASLNGLPNEFKVEIV